MLNPSSTRSCEERSRYVAIAESLPSASLDSLGTSPQNGKRHFYTAPEHLEPLGMAIRESGIERDEFEIAVELG
jgi:hypothetical protein